MNALLLSRLETANKCHLIIFQHSWLSIIFSFGTLYSEKTNKMSCSKIVSYFVPWCDWFW